MIRILIADDHPIFRDGLKSIIEEETDMVIEDEVSSGKEVLSLIVKKKYDVLLLDIDMPEMNGLAVLGHIKDMGVSLPVLMLSFYPESQYAVRSLKLGAKGYLTKDSASTDLVTALRSIAAGRRYITPLVADQLTDYLDPDKSAHPHEQLSGREYEVFSLIINGHSVSEISELLHLSPKTVSTYKNRIFQKMNMENDSQLILYAAREGLVR
jgi:DNA-binding NarL/FixJ family response regulator